MFPHRLLFPRLDQAVAARERTAKENEARGLVRRIDPQRLGLVNLPLEQAAGAGRAPTLQAHVRQIHASRRRGIQQVLVGAYVSGHLSAVVDERHAVARQCRPR